MAKSKYEELLSLAKQKATEFTKIQRECIDFSTSFVLQLEQYLEGPRGCVLCDTLGRDHRPTGKPTILPDPRYFDEDQYWHFYLIFKFEFGHDLSTLVTAGRAYWVGTEIGIKQVESGFMILVGNETYEKTEKAFERLHRDLTERLTKNIVQSKNVFGFSQWRAESYS